MPEEQQIKKAQILFSQKRYPDAEKEFGQLIVQDPANGYFHCMLSLCFLYQGKFEQAEEHVKNAISAEPANSFCYYVASVLYFDLRKIDQSKTLIEKAIELEPFNADYFSIYASIYLTKKEWKLALEKANEGLAIDPEHIDCMNGRAKALIKLDDKAAAYQTIREALYFDPENAHTHANLGWGLIEKGDYKKALDHFQKSLALDPNNSYAKSGLVQALKAKYWFYRIFLRYAFWIANMKSKAQWGILLGFYVGSRLLAFIGDRYPALEVITTPLVILYVVFAISSWIIVPLSNLFLRLNKYGKHALSDQEIQCSNWVGLSFLLSAVSVLLYFVFPAAFFVSLFFVGFTMAIPISGMYQTQEKSRARKSLMVYTIALAATGLVAAVLTLNGQKLVNEAAVVYFIGIILYQWIANAIIIRSN